MIQFFIFSFLLFVLAVCASAYNHLGPIRREKRKAYRYRLFAVRDQLILLVAEGKLEERDPLFQFLYRSTNLLIRLAKPLTLGVFIKAWRQSPAVDEEAIEKFVADLNERSEEVRTSGIHFFDTVGSILFDVSLTVRIAVTAMARIEFFKHWIESAASDESLPWATAEPKRPWFTLPSRVLSFFRTRSEAARVCVRVRDSARALT